MMGEKKLVPKRRFEGFKAEWEICKIKEYVELENGHAFKSAYFQSNVTKKIVLTPGNINIGGGFQIDKGHYYEELADYPKKTVMEPGDIFVTMTDLTPTAQTLGFPAIIPDDGNIYLHNQRLGKLVNYDLDKSYLFNLLCTEKYHNQIVMTASGTTVKHSSPQRILNSLISVPSKEEQQKIGNFFKHLDEMIVIQQRKIDKTKALKSAYLAEMFPAEGERVPKRRFKGFVDEWKVKKLVDIVIEISDGDWIETEHIFNQGKYRIIQTGNLGIGRYIDRRKNAKYFHQEDFDQLKANEIFPGDVLISRLAEPAGRTIILPETGFRMVTSVDVSVIRPNEKFDSTFLMTLMNSEKTLKEVNKEVTGTTHKRISRKNLEKTELIVPEFFEQQKIGQFFKHLDEMIATDQQKLEKLKATKQAYLHEMFV